MNVREMKILTPDSIANSNELQLWDEFFFPMYCHLYAALEPSERKYPHIDFDQQQVAIELILSKLDAVQIRQLRSLGSSDFTASEWNKSPTNKALQTFLWNFPEFANLISNIHLLAPVVLKSTELYLEAPIDTSNFIKAKQLIDEINRKRWKRTQSTSEQQSGVSNLGGVSERLLETAFGRMIDGINFFKNTNQQVQSYGDFVLMCLPNNLWISVKSNFARERFLASGFTTDILGVGFFTEREEFTSISKIRNYQRVGFLAIYLPDVPVSEDQNKTGKDTYNEVIDFYKSNNLSLPININGTAFLRPLSTIHTDLSKVLAVSELKNRTTLNI
jgi:hypothetical protein